LAYEKASARLERTPIRGLTVHHILVSNCLGAPVPVHAGQADEGLFRCYSSSAKRTRLCWKTSLQIRLRQARGELEDRMQDGLAPTVGRPVPRPVATVGNMLVSLAAAGPAGAACTRDSALGASALWTRTRCRRGLGHDASWRPPQIRQLDQGSETNAPEPDGQECPEVAGSGCTRTSPISCLRQ